MWKKLSQIIKKFNKNGQNEYEIHLKPRENVEKPMKIDLKHEKIRRKSLKIS